jgi:uncharacterized protein
LPTDYQNEVTTVICRKIKPGHEKDYNEWVSRYLTLVRKAPGYLGITIIVPGGSSKSPLRYIIRRFTDKTSMEAWDNSEESQKLIEEAKNQSLSIGDVAQNTSILKPTDFSSTTSLLKLYSIQL